MKRFPFACLASIASAGMLLCSAQTLAQETRHHIVRTAPDAMHASTHTQAFRMRPASTPPGLYGLQASMTEGFPVIGANADGSDLWPCIGLGSSNLDCPSVGSPSMAMPFSAFVSGKPQFTWMLANNSGYGFEDQLGNGIGCDAYVDGTTGTQAGQYQACGQILTWFEDATNDTTDDLVQRTVVTQQGRIIYDSGLVDFGPAGPTVTYPVSVLLYGDVNFGYWPGSATGPNNGNCSANTGYPLSAPTYPGVYVIAGNSTCGRPVAGKASVHTTTFLATPYYRKTEGGRCAGGSSPCYTVDYLKNYGMEQDFDISLE